MAMLAVPAMETVASAVASSGIVSAAIPVIEKTIAQYAPGIKNVASKVAQDTSLRDLFLYKSSQKSSEPTSSTSTQNNGTTTITTTTTTTTSSAPETRKLEAPNAIPKTEPSLDRVSAENKAILEKEQEHLKKEEEEIEKLEEQVKTKPTLQQKLDRYISMYQRNLEIFQKQLDSAESLFQQSRSRKYY